MQNCQVQAILRNIPTLHRIPSSLGNDTLLPPAERQVKTSKKAQRKKMRALAEAVILQSIEDLWSRTNRRKSVDFFMGDGFSLYADMAGMKIIDRLRLFRMLRKRDPRLFDSRHARKVDSIVNTLA